MSDRDKILSKIIKLLEKADPARNEFEAEVEQALIMAQRMMEKYNIDEAELVASGLNNGGIVSRPVIVRAELSDPELALAGAIINMCNVKAMTRNYVNNTASIVFIGAEADVSMAIVMYLSLDGLINARADTVAPGQFGSWDIGGPGQFNYEIARRSFCLGFIENIRVRVQQRKKDREEGDPDTKETAEKYALIVATKGRAIDKYIETMEKPPTHEVKMSQEPMCRESYQRGYMAGGDASIDVNKSIEVS